jgi:hypothetical protein
MSHGKNTKREIQMIESTTQRPTRDEILGHISDLYKQVYGTRPSLGNYSTSSDEELWAEIQGLQKMAEENFAEEQRIEKQKVVEFEQLINKTIQSGAGDRATALRWLYDGSEASYGGSELLWKYGISSHSPEGRKLEQEIEMAISKKDMNIQEQRKQLLANTKERLFENFKKVNKIKLNEDFADEHGIQDNNGLAVSAVSEIDSNSRFNDVESIKQEIINGTGNNKDMFINHAITMAFNKVAKAGDIAEALKQVLAGF